MRKSEENNMNGCELTDAVTLCDRHHLGKRYQKAYEVVSLCQGLVYWAPPDRFESWARYDDWPTKNIFLRAEIVGR